MTKHLTIFIFVIAILSSTTFYLYKNFASLYTAISPVNRQDQANAINTTGLTPATNIKAISGYQIYSLPFQFQKPRDIQKISATEFLVSDLTGQIELIYLDPADNNYKNKTVAKGLKNPHGLAFGSGFVFVAQETSLNRYRFDSSKQTLTLDKKILDLPSGGRHVSRSLALKKDGTLFVSLGSTCDTCIETKPWIGTVIKTNINGDDPTVFAKGLRNAVFLTLHPQSEDLYATEMGRDFLGDNLPPDEINLISQNKDYGWPYCYGDKVFDKVFNQKDQSYCQSTEAPVYQIPAHSAPLGLTFAPETFFDAKDTLLVSYHGSWNSSTPKGYKIVKLTKTANSYTESDFITGFVQGRTAQSRPVDVEFLDNKTLVFSDDKGGNLYLVQKQ